MTDLRAAGVARQSLETETATLRAAGVVRQGLLLDHTVLHNLRVAGVARLTLLYDAPQVFGMSYLNVVMPIESQDHYISMRYSSDGGASWSSPQVQSLGDVGQYGTNIQFRRPASIARTNVFEISWSGDRATAMLGIWLDETITGT